MITPKKINNNYTKKWMLRQGLIRNFFQGLF